MQHFIEAGETHRQWPEGAPERVSDTPQLHPVDDTRTITSDEALPDEPYHVMAAKDSGALTEQPDPPLVNLEDLSNLPLDNASMLEARRLFGEHSSSIVHPTPDSWGTPEQPGPAQAAGWEFVTAVGARYNDTNNEYHLTEAGQTVVNLCNSSRRPLTERELADMRVRGYDLDEHTGRAVNPYGSRYAAIAIAPPLDVDRGMRENPILVDEGGLSTTFGRQLYTVGIYGLRAEALLQQYGQEQDI